MFSNKQVVETFNNKKKGQENPNKKFSPRQEIN